MNNKRYLVLIRIISFAVPLLVAFLLFFPTKLNFGDWVYYIPTFNAFINTVTSVLLVGALVAIKNKNIRWHRTLMTAGFSLGAIFLLTYVLYHSLRARLFLEIVMVTVYFPMLNLSLLVLVDPSTLVCKFTHCIVGNCNTACSYLFLYSLNKRIEDHKKIVKFTFPIWLYVSITGVVVYLMVSPYYTYG